MNLTIRRIRSVILAAVLILPAMGRAEIIDVTILHTTDLHGHFLPTVDYEGNKDVGGMLQLAALIEQRRAKYPRAVLVDNGDSFQGTVASYLSRGAPAIAWMNSLDYNVWNLGNHEFDWGIDVLAENLRRFSGAVLSANCHWCGHGPSPFAPVKPFIIQEVKGVRIAFIGVNHPAIPLWSRQVLLKDTVIETPVAALFRVMPKVRACKPDVIVVVAHMGYVEEDNMLEEPLQEIIDQFPDIDVLIGGHTHVSVPSLAVGRTLYTQAAYYGIALGELHLVFDTETRALIQKRSLLIPVGPDQPFSMGRYQAVADAVAQARALGTQMLCRIDGALGGEVTNDKESPEQTLIAEAIAAAVGADVVFHGAFSSRRVVSNENLTVDALGNLVPYENFAVTAELTADEIAHVLDSLLEVWGTPDFLFPYGIVAKVDVEGLPGERVISLRDTRGKPLDPTNRYRVAFNSYVAAGAGGLFMPLRAVLDRDEVRTVDTDALTRDAVAALLRKNDVYKPHVVQCLKHARQTVGMFTPVTPNTPLQPGPVRLVEFAFMHPGTRDQEQAGEWFVVKNEGTRTVNLKGYAFSDGDEGGTFRIGKDVLLSPGEVVVFCHTASQFRMHDYAQNPYLRLFDYGGIAGRLNLGNRGDELMIIDPQGRLADQVAYGQHIPQWRNWPAESKAPNHKVGESLCRTPGGWEVSEEPLSQW